MGTILEFKNVDKSFGKFEVLSNFDLKLQDGEFLTLLGPSGCGKTTTLNLVAGFIQPDAGQIYLRGELINDVPPRKRNLSMVFQTWALFPHMNAFDNVAFGLKMRRIDDKKIKSKVMDMIDLVHLSGFEEKFPSQLSGGMRQRLALARALAVDPSILLLDEPLSALDAALRKEMQVEIKRIHDELKVTTIFVTHNQEEALVMSDRVAVMKQGKIMGMAPPSELYSNPGSEFVCTFMGDVNLFTGNVSLQGNNKVILKSGKFNIQIPSRPGLSDGKVLSVAVRPEKVQVHKLDDNGSNNSFPGRVKEFIYNGSSVQYFIEVFEKEIIALEYLKTSQEAIKRGDDVVVEFIPSSLMFIETD